jgi:hypothetical protein
MSKGSWRREIERYLSRLKAVGTILPDTLETLSRLYPGNFWHKTPPSRGAVLASQVAVYSANLFSTAIQIRGVILEQWLTGLFLIVPLNTRFFFEIWGGIHFARTTLKRLVCDGNFDKEELRINRLIQGSRTEIKVPWGGVSQERSFNVLDFIDGLADVRTDARSLYDFLSEASHPNFIQNIYFQIAGDPISNWDNERFNTHGHSLLDRTLVAFEVAASGVDSDIVALLQEGSSYVQQCIERGDNGA